MKKITLKQNGTFEHQWVSGLHTIPVNAIDVSDAVFMVLSQNHKQTYDKNTKTIADYVAPFILEDEKIKKENLKKANKKKLLTSNFTHNNKEYYRDVDSLNRLYRLIALGSGGSILCIDIGSRKEERMYHLQDDLISLASAIMEDDDFINSVADADIDKVKKVNDKVEFDAL